MIGCLTSAAVLFAIGSRLGKTRVKRLMGKRFDTISQRIASKGILTTAILRNIPIAPFSLVNFAAGVSHLRFWDYIVGTALGMAPGVGAASFLGDRLIQVFDDPSLANLGLFALFVTVIAIAAITLAKMFVRSSQR
jgi:uncharacterized membrane protein YdjX (TVP38/TMEM64 family)